MEITHELLTGNVNLTLEVYVTPEECDHPERFKVTITPTRAAQIRQMAAIVREHAHDGLELWSIRGWDYSGDWLNAKGYDDDGEPILDELTPERMDCCRIEVDETHFWFEALVKNCDISCETEWVRIAELPGNVEGEAPKRASSFES